MRLLKTFLFIVTIAFGLLIAWFWKDIDLFLKIDTCLDRGGDGTLKKTFMKNRATVLTDVVFPLRPQHWIAQD